MNKSKTITIKTSKVSDFMLKVKQTMQFADKGAPIESSLTLAFEEPIEMLRFLTKQKLNIIKVLREHPDSVSNIAKHSKLNRASTHRHIREMEKFGLVSIEEKVNPGHGRHKIVQMVAPSLHLEAYV